MLNFIKKNIWHITIVLTILEIFSCIYNAIDFTLKVIGVFFLFTSFSVFIFFFNCKIIKKGFISDRDLFVLFCWLSMSFILCIISIIIHNESFTFASIATGLFSISQLILVKLFDIKLF